MKYFKTKNIHEKLQLLIKFCETKIPHGMLICVSPTKQESSGGG